MLPIHFQQIRYRIASLVLGIMLVTLAPAANAVTKHLSVTDGKGQPLVSTMITITAPDGSSVQKSTDEKAILEHNFRKNGVYTLSDPAGNVVKTISIAGSGFSSKAMAITAVAAGAALLLVAAGSGGDSDSGGDNGSGDTGGDLPADGGGDTPVDGGSLGGTYNVSATVASNPGDLPDLISTLVLQFEVIGTDLTITQVSSNENFPAQLTGTIVNGSFSASANGNYAETQTQFQLAGSIGASQSLSFLINIGTDGSLAGGQAITYNATGTKQ